MTIRTIFKTSDDFEQGKADLRESLLEMTPEDELINGEPEGLSDEAVWESMRFDDQFALEMLTKDLDNLLGNKTYYNQEGKEKVWERERPSIVVFTGATSDWRGRHEIEPTLIENATGKEIINKLFPDSDATVHLFDVDGVFSRTFSSHDVPTGSATVEMRLLNEGGKMFIENLMAEDDYDYRSVEEFIHYYPEPIPDDRIVEFVDGVTSGKFADNLNFADNIYGKEAPTNENEIVEHLEGMSKLIQDLADDFNKGQSQLNSDSGLADTLENTQKLFIQISKEYTNTAEQGKTGEEKSVDSAKLLPLQISRVIEGLENDLEAYSKQATILSKAWSEEVNDVKTIQNHLEFSVETAISELRASKFFLKQEQKILLEHDEEHLTNNEIEEEELEL